MEIWAYGVEDFGSDDECPHEHLYTTEALAKAVAEKAVRECLDEEPELTEMQKAQVVLRWKRQYVPDYSKLWAEEYWPIKLDDNTYLWVENVPDAAEYYRTGKTAYYVKPVEVYEEVNI